MSSDWPDKLRAESERWVRQGLISEQQRGAILRLYPADAGAGRDRTVMIFSILGSLLVGAGVILYFAANWPLIPAGVKVAAILAATLGSYAAGFYFQYRRGDSPRLGQGLIFLGSLLYGAGIWLIAQIFHLDTDFPTGFLAWGGGILPLVWATGSRPVLYLATALLTVWTVGAQTEMGQQNYLFPLVMLGAVLPLARRTETRLAEAGVLLSLLLWFLINVGRTDLDGVGGAPMLVVGRLALLYGSAVFLAGLARLGDRRTYLGSGGFVGLAGAYLLTFNVPRWAPPVEHELPSLFAGTPYTVAGTLILLVGAVAAAWLYRRRAEEGWRYLLPAALAPVAAVLLAEWLPEVARMVFFNLFLLGGVVGLVAVGIQQRTELLVNLGLIAFAVHLITRYFDLFFSAMNRSFFFIFGGVLLLAGGWFLERNRRRWVGDLKGGAGDEP
ncbi:MAG: DUF2157 domain-containing protein [Bacillota bacterium]